MDKIWKNFSPFFFFIFCCILYLNILGINIKYMINIFKNLDLLIFMLNFIVWGGV